MISHAINGENETEVYLMEPITRISHTKDDSAKEIKKTNLEKTHQKPIKSTGVFTEMTSIRFNRLWLKLVENHAKVNAYDGMERMMELDGLLEIPKYNMLKDQIEWIIPNAIFRSFVTMPVLSATFEGAGNIIVTKDIEIMHRLGKKRIAPVSISNAKQGYGFRNPREPVAEDMKLIELTEMNYSGYMYRISVPKLDNYVCQGLLIKSV